MDKALEQKLSDVDSWKYLLSKPEQYVFEVNKPASLVTLWAKIHTDNAGKILSSIADIKARFLALSVLLVLNYSLELDHAI